MVGKITKVTLEFDFNDYTPCLRTIGQRLDLTKIGTGEIVAYEIKDEKIITTIEILSSHKSKDIFQIDVYPAEGVK